MKIFLSGSTSFLGCKFIELNNKDFDIYGFSKTDLNSIDITNKEDLSDTFEKFQPDVVLHFAAIASHYVSNISGPNIEGTQNLVDLAKLKEIPFVFMSSEAVYGGSDKVDLSRNISEDVEFNSKSEYAETKIKSEEIVRESGIPYLILRAHRFVGICKNYDKPKQFPDTIKALKKSEEVHLDNKKLFRPTFLNHLSEVIVHYLKNDLEKKLILNVVLEKTTTYYDLIMDCAKVLGFDPSLIHSDGEEKSWPAQSTLDISKLKELGYPTMSYDEFLTQLQKAYDE